MDILQVASELRIRFFRKLGEVLPTSKPLTREVSAIKTDPLGRLEVVTVGPGFQFHLRNVNSITFRTSSVQSNGFGFDVDTANRETVAREKVSLKACDEILSCLRKEGGSGD